MRGYRLVTGFLAWVLLPGLVWADINPGLYKPYQSLLSNYLIEETLPGNGLVSAFDYQAALADTDLAQTLEQQRKALAEFDTGTLEAQKESVAFWVNAYNFFMLEQILTERPDGQLVSSVWDYGGRVNPFVDSVFERESFVIGGERFSLSQIEKGVLLGKDYQSWGWKDARVHFAVNCASVGCPPLRNTLYTADNLEGLLAENTRRALNTDRHLKIQGDTLYVTELFKWYEDDFNEASGSTKAFIEEWADSAVLEGVVGTSSIKFINYDWALNLRANFPELR